MAIFTKFIEKERVRRILPFISGSVLDLGCGYNPLVQYLEPGNRYVGVERQEDIIRWLKDRFPGISFYQCDLNKQVILPDEKFNRIVLMAVIEHLDCPEKVLAQLLPYFETSGKLVLTTPSPLGNWIHHFGAKINLFSNLAAEEHNIIFNRIRMKKLLADSGYRLIHYETFLLFGNQLVVAEPSRAR